MNSIYLSIINNNIDKSVTKYNYRSNFNENLPTKNFYRINKSFVTVIDRYGYQPGVIVGTLVYRFLLDEINESEILVIFMM